MADQPPTTWSFLFHQKNRGPAEPASGAEFGVDKAVYAEKDEQEHDPFAILAQVEAGIAEEADGVGYSCFGLDGVAGVSDGLLITQIRTEVGNLDILR